MSVSPQEKEKLRKRLQKLFQNEEYPKQRSANFASSQQPKNTANSFNKTKSTALNNSNSKKKQNPNSEESPNVGFGKKAGRGSHRNKTVNSKDLSPKKNVPLLQKNNNTKNMKANEKPSLKQQSVNDKKILQTQIKDQIPKKTTKNTALANKSQERPKTTNMPSQQKKKNLQLKSGSQQNNSRSSKFSNVNKNQLKQAKKRHAQLNSAAASDKKQKMIKNVIQKDLQSYKNEINSSEESNSSSENENVYVAYSDDSNDDSDYHKYVYSDSAEETSDATSNDFEIVSSNEGDSFEGNNINDYDEYESYEDDDEEDDYEEDDDSFILEGESDFNNFESDMSFDYCEEDDDDSDYELPEHVPEDLIIHQGTCIKRDLRPEDNVSFDSDIEKPQIVELETEQTVNIIEQPTAYKKEELLKLKVKEKTESLQEKGSISSSDSEECPELVPIVEKDGFVLCNPEKMPLYISNLSLESDDEDESMEEAEYDSGSIEEEEYDEEDAEELVEEYDEEGEEEYDEEGVEDNEEESMEVEEEDEDGNDVGAESEDGDDSDSEEDDSDSEEDDSDSEEEDSNCEKVDRYSPEFDSDSDEDDDSSSESVNNKRIPFKHALDRRNYYNSDVETKFFNAFNANTVLVVLKDPIYIYGTLRLTLLAGSMNVYGHSLNLNTEVEIFSPRGCSEIVISSQPSEQKISKESLNELLKSYEKQFTLHDLKTIVSLYEAGKDSVVLLKRNDERKKVVQQYKKFMNENVFPNIKNISVDRHLYNAEYPLCCMINTSSREQKCLRLPKEWEQFNLTSKTRVMVAGGKNVGKSTLLRYLINRHLPQKVLLIDLDIGQPEVFIPQTVSCTIVEQPLLGPGFLLNLQPEISFAVGHTNISLCAHKYLSAVRSLLAYCSVQKEFEDIPWIVNTMGYNKGFGLELISVLVQGPFTDVIQLQSAKKINNFDSTLEAHVLRNMPHILFSKEYELAKEEAKVDCDYRLHLWQSAVQQESRYQKEWEMSARDFRFAILLARLSQALLGHADWLTDVKPLCASLDNLKILNLMDNTPLISAEELERSIEANLVYLCHYEEDNKPLKCLGIGVVRAIDFHVRHLYLIPALPYTQLKEVNCLAIGEMPLPTSLFTNQGSKVKNIAPFVYNTAAASASKAIKQIFHRPSKFLTGRHRPLD